MHIYIFLLGGYATIIIRTKFHVSIMYIYIVTIIYEGEKLKRSTDKKVNT